MASEHLDNNEFIKKFHIPSSLLEQDTEVQCPPSTPEHPVLVFINSRSGGQLGGELLVTYKSILNEKQVKINYHYFVCSRMSSLPYFSLI